MTQRTGLKIFNTGDQPSEDPDYSGQLAFTRENNTFWVAKGTTWVSNRQMLDASISEIRDEVQRLKDGTSEASGLNFANLPERDAVSLEDELPYNQPKDKIIISNREFITDDHIGDSGEPGVIIGELPVRGFDIDGTGQGGDVNLHYVVTEGVNKLGVGGNTTNFQQENLSKDRIIEIHDRVREGVEAALVIRQATVTNPQASIILLTGQNLQPVTFYPRGTEAGIRAFWEDNIGTINDKAVGGYVFRETLDNPGQFGFDDLATARIYFQASPSYQAGGRHPHFTLAIADRENLKAGLKKSKNSALYNLIKDLEEDRLSPRWQELASLAMRVLTLENHSGQHGSNLDSINGFPLTAPTYEALMGPLNNNEYTLNVSFFLSEEEAKILNDLAGSNLQLIISGLSSLADPPLNSFQAGENGAVFKFGRAGASTFIEGSLDPTTRTGFLDTDFRYVSLGADGRPNNTVNERITRASISIDSSYRLERAIQEWALRGFTGTIPLEFIPVLTEDKFPPSLQGDITVVKSHNLTRPSPFSSFSVRVDELEFPNIKPNVKYLTTISMATILRSDTNTGDDGSSNLAFLYFDDNDAWKEIPSKYLVFTPKTTIKRDGRYSHSRSFEIELPNDAKLVQGVGRLSIQASGNKVRLLLVDIIMTEPKFTRVLTNFPSS